MFYWYLVCISSQCPEMVIQVFLHFNCYQNEGKWNLADKAGDEQSALLGLLSYLYPMLNQFVRRVQNTTEVS